MKNVKVSKRGYYNVININFDHKVLAGLTIVTTRNPATIPLGALEAQTSSAGKGFWASVGSALVEAMNIGGGYFRIEPPGKRYYE